MINRYRYYLYDDSKMITVIQPTEPTPQLVNQPFGSSTIQNIFLGGFNYVRQ